MNESSNDRSSFFARMTLASKFATSLSIVLALFFVASVVALTQEAEVLTTEVTAAVVEVIARHEQTGAMESMTGEVKTAVAQSLHQTATTIIIATAVASVAVVAAVYLLFVKLVRRRIKGLEQRFIDVCDGDSDLSRRIEVHGNDGVDRLGGHFNRFLDKVHGIVRQVVADAEQLVSSSSHVSTTTRASTQSILQQQSETDQVAAAMNQMTASVQEVARNVGAAAEAAQNAEHEARAGSEVVEGVVSRIRSLADEVGGANDVMQRLRTDSEQIGTVLDVIRGIAEQTNLLALNAAIEAARAGEQGRGFAVVADEVRTLAGRTQQSTEEIHKMIERLQSGANDAVSVIANSRQSADTTVEQAAEAGAALRRITDAVSTINQMNSQIASAANQQSSVASEVDVNISNISQSAESTSVQAQETAAECEQLASLAKNLQGSVGQFRV